MGKGSTATGAGIGMGVGAAAGTAVMPGVGTALGGLGGAMVGGAFGSMLGGGGEVEGYGGPTMDWAQYDAARAQTQQARAQQQQVYDMLEARARGQGRSVAQAQLAQATGNTMAAARSQAASARGGALAQSSAQRSAMYAGAGAMQQAAGQTATLRAQEQAAAERALADQANTLRAQDMQRMGLESQTTLGYGGIQNQAAGINMQAKIAQANNESNTQNGMLSMGGSILGKLSDERAKQDVHPADREIEDFLSALAAKRYEYKPGVGEGPGEQFGVMAQDAEKTRVGKTMVKERPDGMKTLDGRPGLGILLAAMANVHDRLSKMEGGR